MSAIEIFRQLTTLFRQRRHKLTASKVVEDSDESCDGLLMFCVFTTAQTTQAGLLKLDREFAKATSEKRLDGWMGYMMDSTVVFGPPHLAQRIVGRGEIRNYYRDMFGMPDFNMSWTSRTAQLLPSGQTG